MNVYKHRVEIYFEQRSCRIPAYQPSISLWLVLAVLDVEPECSMVNTDIVDPLDGSGIVATENNEVLHRFSAPHTMNQHRRVWNKKYVCCYSAAFLFYIGNCRSLLTEDTAFLLHITSATVLLAAALFHLAGGTIWNVYNVCIHHALFLSLLTVLHMCDCRHSSLLCFLLLPNTALRPFVYPGEPVPEETSIHSHPSCSSTILIIFLHLLRTIASSLLNPCTWQSLCTTSNHVH